MMSNDKIDTGKTFLVYFLINNEEECIEVNVNAVYTDESIQSEVSAKTFFIVEKAVDISKFGDPGERVYFTELGRNFDFSWNRERELRICTSELDPIKKLRKDIYRIRFTIFREENFNYEVYIKSENRIVIEESLPKIN
ncbi:MAG: hypothetical protein MUC95_05835 [Spirochaetes bacterium]|nr:hypothetical protein [Spirochaetota bacterium]